ncbi:MAG TPA: iron ABC transporter permease [Syntrophales bacterium]|nr:iron ABC transporter permease [Smithellaceae bacterium]HPL64811.1 iron ABC transporter permease [Syntrophales bacterium]
MSHLDRPSSCDYSERLKTRKASISDLYRESIRKRILLFGTLFLLLLVLIVHAIAVGHYDMSMPGIVKTLLGFGGDSGNIVIWNIRMPRIVAAIVTGCALGLSGVAMQSLLRNPLASPFTLGISQGAAFGAAFSIVFLGAGIAHIGTMRMAGVDGLLFKNVYIVTLCAFFGAMIAMTVILLLARLKKMSPESIILAGVAMSSLFTSGTILVQYFASEVELASVVFWTFGDVTRSSWPEIALLTAVTLGVLVYFVFARWDLNAISAGEDTARSLGVEVERFRLTGMLLASLVAALATALHGVIAFLGLLAPHIGRRLAGADHRLLVPYSCLVGAMLLLLADTIGRLMVGSGTLPVGVLTSFMGAPLFLYLLIRGLKR